MPSGIEIYDEKKKALVAASAELAALKDKLNEIVKALTLFPSDLLERQNRIRYPIKDDGSVDYPTGDEGIEAELTKLDMMPDKAVLRDAITKLKNAKLERDKAFAALSEVEKTYVRERERPPHLRSIVER